MALKRFKKGNTELARGADLNTRGCDKLAPLGAVRRNGLPALQFHLPAAASGIMAEENIPLTNESLYMPIKLLRFLFPLTLFALFLNAQSTVPTFSFAAAGGSYTIAGKDPAKGGTSTIPTVLIPVTLVFESKKGASLDAAPDVPRVLHSPVFSKFAFPSGGTTQYTDAMLRTTFDAPEDWHTLLGNRR